MKSVEKSAKTYEEAVAAALSELDAAISDVDVLVLEEGSKGLFGLFGSRPTKVRVTLKEKEEEDDLLSILFEQKKPEPKPARRSEPKPAEPKEEPKPAEPKEEPKAEAVKSVESKPARPEPVRRTAPQKKPAEPKTEVKEASAAAPVQAEAAPAAPAQDAAEAAAKPEKPARAPRQRQPKADKPKQPRQPKAEKAEKAEKPEQEKKPLPPKAPVKPIEKPVVTMLANEDVTPDSAAGKAQSFLRELTHLMGVEVDVAVGNDEEGNVFVQMTGDTLGVLIGRRGETLGALQYLTSLKGNHGQEGYTRVTLDTENYRAKREDTLIRLANRMANRAVKTGRKVSLEPMNPYERRIIHSALQANEAVDTHSEGEEPNRHVVITLRKA